VAPKNDSPDRPLDDLASDPPSDSPAILPGISPGQPLDEILGDSGPFKHFIDGFKPRPQQLAMAHAVARAIAQQDTLACEACTGTGKTFAYLVPAVLSGKRVIISTGTRNLQDQLFHRDLPLVREALAAGGSIALLKGRANYLCLHRLEECAEGSGELFTGKVNDFKTIREWAGRTRSGDIAEVSGVAENAQAWSSVTSTSENCLGQDCKFYDECHVVNARRDAASADIVVVNHHLFLADMALREEGFGEIIPGVDAVIFDEAHQLPELATQFFGTSVTSRQVTELARDTLRAAYKEAGDTPGLVDIASALETGALAFRSAVGGKERREEWQRLRNKPEIKTGFVQIGEQVAALLKALETVEERGAELQNCARRVATLNADLQLFAGEGKDTSVRWMEVQRRGFTLHHTPVDIAEAFSSRLNNYPSARVFTSATLAVGDTLEYFTGRLGLSEVTTHCWGSPFYYEDQSLLYQPAIDAEPKDPDYTRLAVQATLPVLEASGGRAFLLFTSHRALQEAHQLLKGNADFELFVQGDAPKRELLERFRQATRSVLLGSNSFWEGVDVRGDDLIVVMIDKLPFGAPDDPMLQARSALLREQGLNPFMKHQLPEAVLALKQGAGRLIRDEEDYGVLVLCDPRLNTRSYGKKFLDGLPPMKRVSDIAAVEQFFSEFITGETSEASIQ